MRTHPCDIRRTAIYDIAARTVYLPNGRRLEAHSGLGDHMDDPRYVNAKNTGPTPPNVYELKLRESLFHGVRAIRLVPTDDSKMHGRAGILAHSYCWVPAGNRTAACRSATTPRFWTRICAARSIVSLWSSVSRRPPPRRQPRIGAPTRSRTSCGDPRPMKGEYS